MYRKCVTEISVQHQKQVEEALLMLMQQMPLSEITVTHLCRESGVSRRIFYHLFSNKTGALYALIDHYILDMGSSFLDVEDQALRFFLYWKQQKKFLDALCSNDFLGLLLERMILNVLSEDYDLLYWLRSNGWKQEKDVLIFNLSGVMGMVCSWYYSGYEKSPEEMAALITHMMTHPLASPNQVK